MTQWFEKRERNDLSRPIPPFCLTIDIKLKERKFLEEEANPDWQVVVVINKSGSFYKRPSLSLLRAGVGGRGANFDDVFVGFDLG